MKDTDVLVEKILNLQKNRDLEINEEIKEKSQDIKKLKIRELQNTIAITSLENKIQKIDKNNLLLQEKINSKLENQSYYQNIQNKILYTEDEIKHLSHQKTQWIHKMDEETELKKKTLNKKLNILNQQIYSQQLNIQNLENKKHIFEANFQNEEIKFQQNLQDCDLELENLRIEFQLYGNIRFLHRNSNLENIIHYQKESKKIKPKLDQQNKNLENKKQELIQFEEQRKKELQDLLSTHITKLKNYDESNKTEENIYQNIKREQDNFKWETKRKKTMIQKEIMLLEHQVQEIINYQNEIKTQLQSKNLNHQNTLQSIKKIKYEKTQLIYNFDIRKIKFFNHKNLFDRDLEIQKLHLEQLEHQKIKSQDSIFTTRKFIPHILENHLQILLHQKYLTNLKLQIDKFQSNHHNMIDFYHQELKNNKFKIDEYKSQIKTLKSKMVLEQLRIKRLSNLNRNECKKRIKDNNQKILKELDILSSIINQQ